MKQYLVSFRGRKKDSDNVQYFINIPTKGRNKEEAISFLGREYIDIFLPIFEEKLLDLEEQD